eukprot:scaffold1081_cov112-Isochrysis_galbana.AAC.4
MPAGGKYCRQFVPPPQPASLATAACAAAPQPPRNPSQGEPSRHLGTGASPPAAGVACLAVLPPSPAPFASPANNGLLTAHSACAATAHSSRLGPGVIGLTARPPAQAARALAVLRPPAAAGSRTAAGGDGDQTARGMADRIGLGVEGYCPVVGPFRPSPQQRLHRTPCVVDPSRCGAPASRTLCPTFHTFTRVQPPALRPRDPAPPAPDWPPRSERRRERSRRARRGAARAAIVVGTARPAMTRARPRGGEDWSACDALAPVALERAADRASRPGRAIGPYGRAQVAQSIGEPRAYDLRRPECHQCCSNSHVRRCRHSRSRHPLGLQARPCWIERCVRYRKEHGRRAAG